jgi:hypothetical protein
MPLHWTLTCEAEAKVSDERKKPKQRKKPKPPNRIGEERKEDKLTIRVGGPIRCLIAIQLDGQGARDATIAHLTASLAQESTSGHTFLRRALAYHHGETISAGWLRHCG